MIVQIYTDGACEPNPGVGGWGVVVFENGSETLTLIGGAHDTTNNIMELTAVLKALEWCIAKELQPNQVIIKSDSKYVCNGCNEWRHGWKRKHWRRGHTKPLLNAELWKALDAALIEFPIKLEWVKGHNGILGNERADELAGQGRSALLASLESAE